MSSTSSPLAQIDANVQMIQALEGASTLPSLPSEVGLDLAGTTAMAPSALMQLFVGLENDIQEAQAQQPLPVRHPDIWTPLESKYSRGEETARLLYGVSGQGRVERFDPNAVQEWKRRAVDGGYLDLNEEQIQDSRWLPEYSSVAAEMMREQSRREFSGDKPGSVSVDTVMNLVEDWLSPKGLYQAALELDLFWDFGSIARETESWGNKLKLWSEEPWNPARAIDALTGPIDDVAFPIINWALMFTGIGEMWLGVKAASVSAKVAKRIMTAEAAVASLAKAEHVAGLYRGAKGLKALPHLGRPGERALVTADRLADADAFRTQSFSAMLLGPKQGGPTGPVSAALEPLRTSRLGSATHQQMQAWRNLSGVVGAKKVNQQVLKLGFSSNVQGLVDDERGRSLASETGLDEAVAAVMSNPMAEWSVDLLLYPPNLFERGAVKAGLQAVGRGVAKVGGWERLTQNQELTLAWHKALRLQLEEADDAAALAKFDQDVQDVGVIQALANNLSDGRVEDLGQTMGFVTMMGSIDAAARTGGYHGLEEGVGLAAEEAMDAGTRGRYHRNRNHLIGQLRHYDPDDIDDIMQGLAAHGPTEGIDLPEELARVSRPSAGSEQAEELSRVQRLRKNWLEDAEVTAARNGGVADGDVRLYGSFDPDDPEQILWSTAMPDMDDPYFVDVNLAEFGLVPGQVTDRAQELGELLRTRYRIPGARQAKLSQATEVGRFDPEKVQYLKSYAQQHNDRRAEFIASMMSNVNPQLVSQYVYETLPTFGRWTDFSNAIHEARMWVRSGKLDNVELLAPVGPGGQRSALIPRYLDGKYPRETWYRELDELVNRMGNDSVLRQQLMNSVFSPLVREVDPTKARITVQALDQPTKGEVLGFHQLLKQHLRKSKMLNNALSRNPEMLEMLDEALVGTQEVLGGVAEGTVTRERIAAVVAAAASEFDLTGRAQTELRILVRDAMSEGISMSDLRKALDTRTGQLLADERFAHYGVPGQVGMKPIDSAASLDDLLQAKMDELMAQSRYIAAEIDAPGPLADGLYERGYRLVYGANFAAPEDVMDLVPQFADLSHRQVRSGALRSWFGRKDPEYVRRVKNRVVKSSLRAEFARSRAEGKDIRLNLDEDATVNQLISDLYDTLHAVQDDARIRLDTSQTDGIVSKVGTRVSLARIPFDLSRMPSDVSFKKFKNIMTTGQRLGDAHIAMGLTADEALAVHRGLMRSQSLGFAEQGLFGIESYLRSKNNAADALRFFGKHKYSDKVIRQKTAGMVNAGLMIAAGGTTAKFAGDEDDSIIENLSQGAVGVLAATGAYKAGARKFAGASPEVGTLAGRVANSKWGYLADNLANVRDLFRFSLSPIFDASRYSEAVILGQVGEMPQELRNLRVNQSPKGVRSAIAREARKAGRSDREARAIAEQAWEANRKEFAAVAKGDLEMETIDSVARRFSSVGILGFSPTDWMESTYWHLRQAGVDPGDAYKAVRDTYTYGVTGRSSAELSMNFVFFPFSFTKKVATHLGKFFDEDLGRLILIQDGLAAYQSLSEQYDLSEEFRDRLPILNRMNRMNVLAYGLSPGRFGGVNAPMIGAALDTPVIGDMAGTIFDEAGIDDVAGLFMPQMVQINNEQDATNILDMLQQVMPAMNDVNQLISDFYEQSRVVASSSHLTSRAEARRGWEEWRSYQDEIKPFLQQTGMSWAQASQLPEFAAMSRAKRAELAAAYPSWKQAYGDGIARGAALDLEMQERLHNPKGKPDELLALFQQDYNALSDALSNVGLSMSNPEELPPEVYDVMRRRAIELAQQDHRFKRIYDRFYRRLFGDISLELI